MDPNEHTKIAIPIIGILILFVTFSFAYFDCLKSVIWSEWWDTACTADSSHWNTALTVLFTIVLFSIMYPSYWIEQLREPTIKLSYKDSPPV
jgi:hypothetical protein